MKTQLLIAITLLLSACHTSPQHTAKNTRLSNQNDSCETLKIKTNSLLEKQHQVTLSQQFEIGSGRVESMWLQGTYSESDQQRELNTIRNDINNIKKIALDKACV